MKKLVPVIVVIGVIAIIGFVVSTVVFADPLAKKGRKLYAYYCTHCHGEKGQGNGYNAVNLDPKPRDHTDSGEPYMAGRTNEELFEAVNKGGAGISKSPFMPPFGGVFSEEEIWSLVSYLRTIHSNKAPKVVAPADAKKERPKFPAILTVSLEIPGGDEGEDGEGADPEETKRRLARVGQRLFEEKFGCISCHRVRDIGGAVGPSLTRVGFRLRPEYIFRWIKNPQAIKHDTKMPNFQLRDRDALAITAYLSTLKDPPEGPPETRGGRP